MFLDSGMRLSVAVTVVLAPNSVDWGERGLLSELSVGQSFRHSALYKLYRL